MERKVPSSRRNSFNAPLILIATLFCCGSKYSSAGHKFHLQYISAICRSLPDARILLLVLSPNGLVLAPCGRSMQKSIPIPISKTQTDSHCPDSLSLSLSLCFPIAILADLLLSALFVLCLHWGVLLAGQTCARHVCVHCMVRACSPHQAFA